MSKPISPIPPEVSIERNPSPAGRNRVLTSPKSKSPTRTDELKHSAPSSRSSPRNRILMARIEDKKVTKILNSASEAKLEVLDDEALIKIKAEIAEDEEAEREVAKKEYITNLATSLVGSTFDDFLGATMSSSKASKK